MGFEKPMSKKQWHPEIDVTAMLYHKTALEHSVIAPLRWFKHLCMNANLCTINCVVSNWHLCNLRALHCLQLYCGVNATNK